MGCIIQCHVSIVSNVYFFQAIFISRTENTQHVPRILSRFRVGLRVGKAGALWGRRRYALEAAFVAPTQARRECRRGAGRRGTGQVRERLGVAAHGERDVSRARQAAQGLVLDAQVLPDGRLQCSPLHHLRLIVARAAQLPRCARDLSQTRRVHDKFGGATASQLRTTCCFGMSDGRRSIRSLDSHQRDGDTCVRAPSWPWLSGASVPRIDYR
jgi:hypothetical protein